MAARTAAIVAAAANLSTECQRFKAYGAEPAATQQQEAASQVTTAPVDGSNNVSEKLQGKWITVKLEEAGKVTPEAELKARQHILTFTTEKLLQSYLNKKDVKVTVEGSVKIDATKSPLEMDWSDMVQKAADDAEEKEIPVKIMGIFELDGDTLKIHFRAHLEGKDFKGNPVQRPSDFKKTEQDALGDVLMTLKREKS
jgi:uncharacterized protein (TIGR03067 family)